MRIKYLTLIISASLFYSCGQKNNRPDKEDSTTLKLIPVVFGGNRYVIEADFGLENKIPLMIHGNANLYLMITHEIAEKLNHGDSIKKIRDYGYSEKGMGKINVKKFDIGNRTFSNVNDVLVFDWPAEEGKAAQGMLGIHFLDKERVRIDFVKEEMQIGVSLNDQPDKNLADQGYSFTNIFIENGEGYINVYFDALKKEIPITVGTVADGFNFDLVTFQDGIETEKTDVKESSPGRTNPQVYTNVAPVKYSIAGQSFEIPPGKVNLYSLAEYENVKQEDLFPYGIFGRDWMKENNAIIDYANKILYFKSQ